VGVTDAEGCVNKAQYSVYQFTTTHKGRRGEGKEGGQRKLVKETGERLNHGQASALLERLHQWIQTPKRLNVARFCQTGIGGWDAIQNQGVTVQE